VRPAQAALVLALVLCAPALCAQDYAQIFGRRWEAAADLAFERSDRWCRRLRDLGADPVTLVPVVFPELLRRSLLRSGAENLGLGTLYVAQGTAAADFSVGLFQMKPSFIETLETVAPGLRDAPVEVRRIAEYPGIDGDWQKRAERLRRIQSEEWQLLYLAGFSLVEEERFGISALTPRERIRFLSAAYNHGFLRPRAEIEAAELLRLFPHGGAFGRQSQFRYAEVAIDFYERLWRRIAGPDEESGPERSSGPQG
jgi:hypothetical protein